MRCVHFAVFNITAYPILQILFMTKLFFENIYVCFYSINADMKHCFAAGRPQIMLCKGSVLGLYVIKLCIPAAYCYIVTKLIISHVCGKNHSCTVLGYTAVGEQLCLIFVCFDYICRLPRFDGQKKV